MKSASIKKLKNLLASLTPGRRLDPNVLFTVTSEIGYIIQSDKPGFNIPRFIQSIEDKRRKEKAK